MSGPGETAVPAQAPPLDLAAIEARAAKVDDRNGWFAEISYSAAQQLAREDVPLLLAELRATERQRKAALDLCDAANMSDVWFAANIRAAFGVCVACGCDLGTTPLCPSCEQSIEASKRERP